MKNISGYDLETSMMIYQWFLILHEFAFKRWVFVFLIEFILFEETSWKKIRPEVNVKQSRDLLTLSLIHTFMWVKDGNEHGVFKQKLHKQNRIYLMHISINISLFST